MSAVSQREVRCLVLAPFFSHVSSANRPRIIAEVLAEFGTVDIVTTSFDHQAKKLKVPFQYDDRRTMYYVPTLAYRHNVSLGRFLSHFFFSIRAWIFYLKRKNKYDVVYATLPLNLLAMLVFLSCPSKHRIVDVVDIWPDVLPFPVALRKVLRPFFSVWKQSFAWAVKHCDMLLTVSDRFFEESYRYFQGDLSDAHRIYIGCQRIPCKKPPLDDRLTIVYIGNIGHLYDFQTLLDVLATTPRKVRLFLIGDGDRKEWLLQELKTLQIEFQYFGSVYDEKHLSEILSQCDVGFNGYRNTTAAFSYKANTYFAASLPILNSMSGDLEHLVVEHGLGFNYSSGSSDSLRTMINGCTKDVLEVCSQNVERFFEAEIELKQVKARLRENFQTTLECSRDQK
ncbi:MAG: glycosyltransferase family 4 protein [Sedimenticola sp.]